MAVTTLQAGPHMRIALSGEFTIAEAAETRDALALALMTSESLELELGALESIDIAGLQILLALARESHPITLKNPTPELQRTVDFLRLSALRAAFEQGREGHHG